MDVGAEGPDLRGGGCKWGFRMRLAGFNFKGRESEGMDSSVCCLPSARQLDREIQLKAPENGGGWFRGREIDGFPVLIG